MTDGIEGAVKLAREAAGDADVFVSGGASTVRQALYAGLVDVLHLRIAPVVLGRGTRLFDELEHDRIELEPLVAGGSPAVTHLTYRVVR